MKFIVAQLGARTHYAVPRILNRAGSLTRLYTDITGLHPSLSCLRKLPISIQPTALRRAVARMPEGIPYSTVVSFSNVGVGYALRRRFARNEEQRSRAHLWVGRAFGKRVVGAGFESAGGVYCFNTAALEILTAARDRGLRTFLEQTIAPKREERRLLLEENKAFLGWEPDGASEETATLLMEREEAEWNVADAIICGSEFVRDGIAKCGGPVHKCVVVPYGVDGGLSARKSIKREGGAPLRVIMVGTVCLRKGVGYILNAAKILKGRAQFRLVGSLSVSEAAQAELRKHVDLVGPVPRLEIGKHFDWADVFILPSICEGSATVTYEALSYGIPVICTPNTGSVVRDGVEGYIVTPRSTDQLVNRIERLIADQELLVNLSARAKARAAEFTVGAYAERLLRMLH